MTEDRAIRLTAAEIYHQRPLTPAQRLRRVLRRYPQISPLVVLSVATIIFGLVSDRFLLASNLSLIVQQVATVGALAAGQTLIILTAGIDLSVGALMVFVSMLMGTVVGQVGWPGVGGLVLGLAVGLAAGAANGLLVAYVRLPPFITTLGTLSVFTALALLMSHGKSIQGEHLGSLLTWTATPFSIGRFNFTVGVALMIAMYVVLSFILHNTAWGRRVYAVGSDEKAAALAGVRSRRVLLSVYVVGGFLVALSAWILIGRNNAATTSTAVDANLDSITAVVIGGTSLFGGRGRLWGTLLGALTVGVFRNGLSLARVDVLYQTLAVGLLILGAVALDQWIRGAEESR